VACAPDTAKEKPMKGKVLAVGDGKWDEEGKHRIPVDVAVGEQGRVRQVLGHRVQDAGWRRSAYSEGQRDPGRIVK